MIKFGKNITEIFKIHWTKEPIDINDVNIDDI